MDSIELKPAGRPIISMTREFYVPRAPVAKVSTASVRMAQCWWPTGFTNPVCKMDVRPGGLQTSW